MRGDWNKKCFICFEELGRPKGNKRGRRRTFGGDVNGVRVLLGYLLRGGREKGSETLVGTIVDMIRKGSYFLCEKCEAASSSTSKLHLELEVTQMKIINLVGTVQNEVIKCSRIPSSNNGNEERRIGNDNHELEDPEKSLEEIIHSFQNAVAESGTPKQVPCVLLERCLGLPVISTNSSPKIKGEQVPQRSSPIPFDHVKTEPEDTEMGGTDDFDTHSFTGSVDLSPAFALPQKVDPDTVKKPVKTRTPRTRRKAVKKKTKGRKLKSKIKPKKIPPKPKANKICSNQEKRKYFKYTCEMCQYDAVSFHKFHYHLLKHETEEKRFHCDTCPNDLWLTGKQLYDLHVESHHQKKHHFFCDFCKTPVDTFFLKDHMMTCPEGPSHSRKIFTCPNCTFCTTSRNKWLRHFQEHDNSAQFICDICSEKCPTRLKLLKHLIQEHKVLEEFKCSFHGCNRTFVHRQQLLNHEVVHTRKFVCQYCKKVCTSLAARKLHEGLHTGDRPITCSCPQCGEGFIVRSQLTRHLIVQHGAPKFKCEFCGKEYMNDQLLRYHMRLHKGGLLPCEICGAQCISKYRLQVHMNTHSTDLIFTCEQCGKSFKSEHSLKTHHKTHSKEKPFKCEYCEKAFRTKSFLEEHLRTHTKERPFVCEICGAGFTQPHSLKTHKLKHSEEDLGVEKIDLSSNC